MTISETSRSRSLSRDVLSVARYYLGSRTGLVTFAATALGAGAYFNWGWLVAAGIAPIILAVAPCAVMCGLGLCMSGHSRKTPSPDAAAEPSALETKKPGSHGKGCC